MSEDVGATLIGCYLICVVKILRGALFFFPAKIRRLGFLPPLLFVSCAHSWPACSQRNVLLNVLARLSKETEGRSASREGAPALSTVSS